MQAATGARIRASFVNCSKGEAKRLYVPRDLAGQRWADLDYLGWLDPRASERAYLVAERDGELVGLALRAAAGRSATGRSDKPGLCAFCVTAQPAGGVRLMTAAKAGTAGRQGDSVGTYICAD